MPTKKSPAKKPLKKNSSGAARTRELIEKGRQYYTHAYKPRDMIIDRGVGATVWDLEGKKYIDLGAGIAVNGLGHHNRDLLGALIKQANKLWHTSNVFFSEPPILLAEALVTSSKFARRVFLTNSGAEANEAAIKLARKYAADKGKPPEQREIISFTGSFHGRTMATVTATAQPKYHAGFEPLPPGFKYCPYNDFDAIEKMVSENTCAVIMEVIQGEGGIVPAASGFVKHVQHLCRRFDALLILDQIQDGMGRTGHLFSHFAEAGVEPDVVTIAKSLGGGMPIGACLIGEKAENTFQYGSHGSTFGGNPLACAVANVVLEKLQTPALIKNIKDRNKQLITGLEAINKRYNIFAEIRGRGLMIGVELKAIRHGKAGDIGEVARKHGVLILQAGPNVLRFLPPLVITQKELAEGLKRLEKSIAAFVKG